MNDPKPLPSIRQDAKRVVLSMLLGIVIGVGIGAILSGLVGPALGVGAGLCLGASLGIWCSGPDDHSLGPQSRQMRVVPAICVGTNIVAASISVAVLWFWMSADPSRSYEQQPDGTTQLKPEYGAIFGMMGLAVKPYLALGLLAWLCRRAWATSFRLLLTSVTVAVLGITIIVSVSVVGWRFGRRGSHVGSWNQDFALLFAWLGQWLIVVSAYVWCAVGWVNRRSRRSGGNLAERSSASDPAREAVS